jgi:hypothetical protein
MEGRCPKEVVVLSDSVYHSYLGEYFFGQTDIISFDIYHCGWGGLINPVNSNVNLFLNAYTISNFYREPITAEGWLGSKYPIQATISHNFAAGNQSIISVPLPKVRIENVSMANDLPSNGTYTFTRRVEPEATLTKHDFQGMYIIPPGSSFTLVLFSEDRDQAQIKIAFGWWEERIR